PVSSSLSLHDALPIFRLFLAVSIATATTTLAAPRARAFDSLRECVPPESFLLIAWRSAPERGYIDRELADVRDALRASDFLDRVDRKSTRLNSSHVKI